MLWVFIRAAMEAIQMNNNQLYLLNKKRGKQQQHPIITK